MTGMLWLLMSLPLESLNLKLNSLNVEVARFFSNELAYFIQTLVPKTLSRTGKIFKIVEGLPL